MERLSFGEAKTQIEIAKCLEVRRKVFIEGQGISSERELRGESEKCRHFYAKHYKNLIAALRVIADKEQAKLQRMAVIESYRGIGVGREMLQYVLSVLKNEGEVATITLGAQEQAIAFYQHAGFEVTSDAFEDSGVTHYLMERKL